MKKSKNLLMMVFVFVCSLLLVGVMNVKATIGFQNDSPVCDPNNNLKPGGTTTCYLRGKATQTQETNKVHGFVTRLYTTDGLRFDDVKPYIDGTSAQAFEATGNSQGKYTIALEGGGDSSTDNKIEFTCSFDSTIKAPQADWQIENGDDYRCALFYSKGKDATVTVSSGTPKEESLKALTGTGSGVMVIGIVDAHIDQNVDANSSCGEICVFTKEATELSSYKLEGTDAYACTEVHYTNNGGPASDTPTTGAFTSYALLAAGALIAISAVAIAKKHNKFYRV